MDVARRMLMKFCRGWGPKIGAQSNICHENDTVKIDVQHLFEKLSTFIHCAMDLRLDKTWFESKILEHKTNFALHIRHSNRSLHLVIVMIIFLCLSSDLPQLSCGKPWGYSEFYSPDICTSIFPF